MYISHESVSVCLSVPRRIPTLLHGPGCNLGNGRWCPLVVHYWADLQSVHGFHSYDITAPNAKCQRVLVLALCLVDFVVVCNGSKLRTVGVSNDDMPGRCHCLVACSVWV